MVGRCRKEDLCGRGDPSRECAAGLGLGEDAGEVTRTDDDIGEGGCGCGGWAKEVDEMNEEDLAGRGVKVTS